MKRFTSPHFVRPALLIFLFGIVLAIGFSGTAWAQGGKPQGARSKPRSTVPAREADLVVDKTGQLTGNRIVWTVTVKNNGPTVATNVVLVDRVPRTTQINSVSTTKGTCGVFRDNKVVCNLGNLAVGETVTVRINTTITDRNARRFTNVAGADSSTKDPNRNNNVDAATVVRPGR